MTEDEVERHVRTLRWAVKDALQAASCIASRASETFDGNAAALLFDNVRKAIAELDRHPAMVALASASVLRELNRKDKVEGSPSTAAEPRPPRHPVRPPAWAKDPGNTRG